MRRQLLSRTHFSKKTAKSLNDAKTKYARFDRQNAELTENKKHFRAQIKKLSAKIEKVLSLDVMA